MQTGVILNKKFIRLMDISQNYLNALSHELSFEVGEQMSTKLISKIVLESKLEMPEVFANLKSNQNRVNLSNAKINLAEMPPDTRNKKALEASIFFSNMFYSVYCNYLGEHVVNSVASRVCPMVTRNHLSEITNMGLKNELPKIFTGD